MTVTYSLDISSSTFCSIHRLLIRWKGSVWKAIWPELLLWAFVYAALSMLYRFILTKDQQAAFESVTVFCYTYMDYIPLTFMLGFYVTIVFNRWKEVLDNLGWIDSPALLISVYVRGDDEQARNIRRNIIRYMVLVQALVFRNISASVKKRFPSMDHLVTAGLMTENEMKEFDNFASPHMKYWVPVNWIFLLLRKARELGMIDSDIIYVDMLEKMRQYRVNVLTLTILDWIPIPLLYTQVVNLAVRAYFAVALMGRQYIINDSHPTVSNFDLYVPFMSILQFLFYIGWMKVAEQLLNPLGEDDDDFETNWIIDRNLQVGLMIVDDACNRVPKLEKDVFWNEVHPEPPYTAEAATRPLNPMVGSCSNIALKTSPHKARSYARLSEPWNSDLCENLDSESEDAQILHHRRARFMSLTPMDNRGNANLRSDEIPVYKRNSISLGAAGIMDQHNRHDSTASFNIATFFDKVPFLRRRSSNASETRIDEETPRKGSSESRQSAASPPILLGDMPNPPRRGTDNSTSNDNPRKLSSPLPQSSSWTVNEMPPIIEEDDHDGRSRKSYNSNASNTASPDPTITSMPKDSMAKLKETLQNVEDLSSQSSDFVMIDENDEDGIKSIISEKVKRLERKHSAPANMEEAASRRERNRDDSISSLRSNFSFTAGSPSRPVFAVGDLF